MKDDTEIIEYLVKKYGYKKGVQPSIFAIVINKRIRKAIEEYKLFWQDSHKEA